MQTRTEEDMQTRTLSPALEEVEFTLLCGRCQDGDPKRYIGGLGGKRAAALRCPNGCMTRGTPARITWIHIQFECEEDGVVAARRRWLSAAENANTLGTDAAGGVPCSRLLTVLRAR